MSTIGACLGELECQGLSAEWLQKQGIRLLHGGRFLVQFTLAPKTRLASPWQLAFWLVGSVEKVMGLTLRHCHATKSYTERATQNVRTSSTLCSSLSYLT